MIPFYHDRHVTHYNADCRHMVDLPDESVQCVTTSPPYWGLRKYTGNLEQIIIWGDIEDFTPSRTKTERWFSRILWRGMEKGVFSRDKKTWIGAYGLEPSPELYIRHTVEILREIRRVLRKDGVVFWNIGDSYAGSGRGLNADGTDGGSGKIQLTNAGSIATISSKHLYQNLKPKDLCLIPFRVAIAAQEDGWWVRSDIIWSKTNPMPESVTDRPTESHEHILMLTKSARYYWDAEAVREAVAPSTIGRGPVEFGGAKGRNYKPDSKDPNFRNGSEQWGRTYDYTESSVNGHNLRSVWTFPTQPYREAHFATFPEALPERCIKAATPEAGCCPKCGKPWVRVVEKKSTYEGGRKSDSLENYGRGNGWKGGDGNIPIVKTLGWQPSCKCGKDPIPSLVLDPFAGSGTTLWVAKKLNRRAVGYEISEEYCKLIVDRNKQQVIL